MINRERLIKSFMEMVSIGSPSFHERSFAEYLLEHLTPLGFEYSFDDAGQKIDGDCGNLLLRRPGTGKSSRPLFFNAHMDTVEPGYGIEPRLENGFIVSSGNTVLGADDKAGIAAILEAVLSMVEDNEDIPPLEILFTVAEEQRLLGARNFDLSRLQADWGYALDCNGPIGRMITAAPAHNSYEVMIRGQAAHAGINPEDGLNAISLASQAINALQLGRLDEKTTANVGRIEGGMATNIVPETVTVYGELRCLDKTRLECLTAETEEIFKSLSLQGAEVKFECRKDYSSFYIPDTALPVELARSASLKLGLRPETASSGGGSDANFFNRGELQVVNLSTGMDCVHSTSERIKIDDLYLLTALIRQIMLEFESKAS
ncbi:MAG: M20/M25/M40 family metallo-hydrolase [bacterium]|jgi:tripeptide aminopeptidase|nr:M20/M25/M40 family metallo-hydrolase [bacterium]